jgi:hypothetical protein
MAAKRKDYTPPTPAEQRAMRDVKQQLSAPNGMAVRCEARFLQHLGAAKDEFRWIVDNNAWTELGFTTFTAWYLQRVQPIALGLGFRPSAEMAWEIATRALADNTVLPKAQRLLQKELADLAGVSESTLRRMLQDHPQPSNGAGSDLETQTTGSSKGVRGSGAQTAADASSTSADDAEADTTAADDTPAPEPLPVSTGEGPGVTPEPVVHEHVGGSAGGPGENSAECACGVVYDGLNTHEDAVSLLELHISTSRLQEGLASTVDAQDSPAAPAFPRGEDDGSIPVPVVEQPGFDAGDRDAHPVTGPDSPAPVSAGVSPSYDAEQQGQGFDSPAGRDPEIDSPASSGEGSSAVATAGRPGTDDLHAVPTTGVYVDTASPAVEGWAGEEPEGTGRAAVPSGDPGDPEHLVQLMRSFVQQLDQVEVDVVGPLLTEEQLADVHQAMDDIATCVGEVEKWRTRGAAA